MKQGTHYLLACGGLDRTRRLAGAGRLGALRRTGRGRRRRPGPAPGGASARRTRAATRAGGGRSPSLRRCCWRSRSAPPRTSPAPSQWQPLALVGLLALLVLGHRHPRAGRQALPHRRARSPGSCSPWRCSGRRRRPRWASPRRWSTRCAAHVRGTYLLNNLLDLHDVPAARRDAPHRLYNADLDHGGYARRGVRRVPRRERPELPDDRRPHAACCAAARCPEMFRSVFVPVLPWEMASA